MRRRPLEFEVGDHVFLKVMPKRGVVRFGKRGKLSPRFIGSFEILERVGTVAYRLAVISTKKLIYLGDGSGDFCPSLKLGNGDYVMPRKNFPLWELIRRNPGVIKAEIHEWSDGEELEDVLLHLIKKISEENNNSAAAAAMLIPVDCKFETMAAQALPQARPVPH